MGIQESCKERILAGQGQMAFVQSTSAGGRSATMLQSYTAIELLEIVTEAIDIKNGVSSGKSVTYPNFTYDQIFRSINS